MPIIDAHTHYGDDHPDVLATLEELDLKLLNICVADEWLDIDDGGRKRKGWREQARYYGELSRTVPQRYAWCTTFDLPRFDDPDYVESVIEGLDRDFAAGAVACKVWKNIGMQVRAPSGHFFMIDDPLLEPVFDHIARAGRTLITHTGAGLAAWLPLNEDNPHYDYYRNHREWYMGDQPNHPSRQEIVASRDRLMERHPDLRVVGAHLGCLEDDLSQVAARLDRYPNFAVDTSARLPDLARQDSAQVREFFLDYPDRTMFGLDMIMGQRPSTLDPEQRAQALRSLSARYRTEFAYFGTADTITVGGRPVQGLGLPDAVQEKLFLANAQRWYPGL